MFVTSFRSLRLFLLSLIYLLIPFVLSCLPLPCLRVISFLLHLSLLPSLLASVLPPTPNLSRPYQVVFLPCNCSLHLILCFLFSNPSNHISPQFLFLPQLLPPLSFSRIAIDCGIERRCNSSSSSRCSSRRSITSERCGGGPVTRCDSGPGGGMVGWRRVVMAVMG